MKKSDASPFNDHKKTPEKVFQKTEPRKITEKQQGSTPLNKLFVKKWVCLSRLFPGFHRRNFLAVKSIDCGTELLRCEVLACRRIESFPYLTPCTMIRTFSPGIFALLRQFGKRQNSREKRVKKRILFYCLLALKKTAAAPSPANTPRTGAGVAAGCGVTGAIGSTTCSAGAIGVGSSVCAAPASKPMV